ncbi:prolipoprotein diacylglyceryl transferase [Lentisphaerota bacterium WC36G]|nr:prolipoprotein diacylglyceryl transferase [Lentisphaerae bacterium WC36]
MERVAFEIFDKQVYWYGIFTALGFLAGYFFVMKNRCFAKMTKDEPANLVMLAAIAGIVGARLFYVVQFWDEQFANKPFGSIFRIDQGGQVFYGGFILAVITIVVFCKIKKLSILGVLDVLAPSLAIGHALGRIGCFINGCCYGLPTKCAISIKYSVGNYPAVKYHNTPLHAVQLYEALANVALFALLMYTIRKFKTGFTVGLYFVCYGFLRYIMEANFRGDHIELVKNEFTKAEIVGMIIIPIGIALMVVSYYINNRSVLRSAGEFENIDDSKENLENKKNKR